MPPVPLMFAFLLLLVPMTAAPAFAQEDRPVSQCQMIAETLPSNSGYIRPVIFGHQ